LAYGKDRAGIYTTSRTVFIESAEAYKSPLARAGTVLRGLPHPNLALDGRRFDHAARVVRVVAVCPSIELIREDIVEIGGIHITAKRITGQ
jgi:hypothetical protein